VTRAKIALYAKALRVLLPIVPAGVGVVCGAVVWVLLAPRHAPEPFYEISAQVTVVLLLAAVVQSPLERLSNVAMSGARDVKGTDASRRSARLLGRLYAVYLALTLLFAEIDSLVVVMRGDSKHANPSLIVFALVAGATAIAVAGMIAGSEQPSPHRRH
jgi:hypothetical protein